MSTRTAAPAAAAAEFTAAGATPVNFDVPRGACDCHVHVFDPANFPYTSRRIYTPPTASIAELCDLQKALHLDRVVVVAPSVYGTDNACTLNAVRALGSRARGVIAVDEKLTSAALDDMEALGVRGIRINLESPGIVDATIARRSLDAIAEQLRGRNWHIQLDTRLSVIAVLKEAIAVVPYPVVFSHFGRARAALGSSQAGFDDLLELLKSGRAYVKISAPYRISDKAPDFPDVLPLAHALVGANAERVLWGSNWPHPGRGTTPIAVAPPHPNDDGHVLNLLRTWIPDPVIRRKVLVDNPARLYRFIA